MTYDDIREELDRLPLAFAESSGDGGVLGGPSYCYRIIVEVGA